MVMPTPFAPGYFVWYDLMTTDRDAATSFYTDLFGWTMQDREMGPDMTYRMISSGDDGLAGIIPLGPEHNNMPSHWSTYISVDDVDKACEKAKELGGQVLREPFDLPDTGRTAVIQDPAGAHFLPFSPAESYNMPDPRPGLAGWNELMSTDVEKANAFYTGLLGWKLGSQNMDQGTYWLYQRGDVSAAGAVQATPEMPISISYWLPYFGVTDVPGTVEKAKELGGKVFVPPTNIEDMNVHFAVLASPDGASFGILEMG